MKNKLFQKLAPNIVLSIILIGALSFAFDQTMSLSERVGRAIFMGIFLATIFFIIDEKPWRKD